MGMTAGRVASEAGAAFQNLSGEKPARSAWHSYYLLHAGDSQDAGKPHSSTWLSSQAHRHLTFGVPKLELGSICLCLCSKTQTGDVFTCSNVEAQVPCKTYNILHRFSYNSTVEDDLVPALPGPPGPPGHPSGVLGF